jgi:hypothetical protein
MTTFDIHIDERASLTVKVNTKKPDGTPRDVTGATIEWNATHNDVEEITKTTEDGTIQYGTPVEGEIRYFAFTFLPDDTVLPDESEYGTPVLYRHEARVYLDAKEFVAIRGRLFITPSQTGEV